VNRAAKQERGNVMRAAGKSKGEGFLSGVYFLLITFCLFCGCSVVEYFQPEGPPSYEQIYAAYDSTSLNMSNAADVLSSINLPEYELLSQSKRVVASAGQKKKGYKSWFNMVAFDENDSTAKRKYLLVVDEKPKILFVSPMENLSFDCEMVIESEVLDKPYADERTRRIAVLKGVLENFRSDIAEVSQENKTLDNSGMMVNQALGTVLVKLDSSPALASRLHEPAGLLFDHVSFGKGKIQMVVTYDIVAVKIRLGSLVPEFEEPDVIDKDK